MIQFFCPHCKFAMEVADVYKGKDGACEKCGQPVTVPMESEAAPSMSLDDLNAAPAPIAPVKMGAYSKSATDQWDDPAEKEKERQRRAAAILSS